MQKKKSNKWAFGLGPLPATQPTSTKRTQLRLLQAFTSAWFRSNISQLTLPSLKNGRTFRTMKKHQPSLQLITAQTVVVTCCDGQNDVDNHDGDHLTPTYFAIFPCDTCDKKYCRESSLPSAYASIVYIVHIRYIYIYLYVSYTSVNPRILAVYALFLLHLNLESSGPVPFFHLFHRANVSSSPRLPRTIPVPWGGVDRVDRSVSFETIQPNMTCESCLESEKFFSIKTFRKISVAESLYILY